jgi:hypothetical protein
MMPAQQKSETASVVASCVARSFVGRRSDVRTGRTARMFGQFNVTFGWPGVVLRSSGTQWWGAFV